MNADVPWCFIFCIQKGSPGAAFPVVNGVLHVEPSADTMLAHARSTLTAAYRSIVDVMFRESRSETSSCI